MIEYETLPEENENFVCTLNKHITKIINDMKNVGTNPDTVAISPKLYKKIKSVMGRDAMTLAGLTLVVKNEIEGDRIYIYADPLKMKY